MNPDVSCPICGGDRLVGLSAAVGERAYCLTCFHGWRTDTPTFAYSTTAMCSLGTSDARLERQIAFFRPFLPNGGRVLEIGCATGELARATRKATLPGRYEAIELSPAGEQALSAVDKLHASPLVELVGAKEIEGPFDLVLMSHVLEHIRDPGLEIAAMKSILAPHGAIFIEVPNGSGNRSLPIDDNSSHLHFFSANSLGRLFANNRLEVVATRTDQPLDDRYSDSLQVIAKPFRVPEWSRTLLSDHAALAGVDKVVVWGAGSLVDEMLANFFDPAKIDYFIDKDPAKQGGIRLGRPVRSPNDLSPMPTTVLVNSIDFAPAIMNDIRTAYPGVQHRLVPIGDLLSRQG